MGHTSKPAVVLFLERPHNDVSGLTHLGKSLEYCRIHGHLVGTTHVGKKIQIHRIV